MSLWADLKRGFSPIGPEVRRAVALPVNAASRFPVQARAIDAMTDFPDLEAQMLAVQGLSPRPWRAAGLREALGVPSILGAVTLIANTVGSLTMRALKNEIEVLPEDRPRVIVRPDPNKLAGEFYRDTAYNLATRGEFWWWKAKRDADGNTIALVNVPPEQIAVEQNAQNILRPKITWNGIGAGRSVIMPNEDMVQVTYLRDSASLRGMGPLQLCGAAISVSVESQEWAANFYADGGTTTAPIIHSAVELADDPNDPDGATEAERFADAWSAKGNNRPRVVDPRIESIDFPSFNPQGAQMLDARMYQNGETARMFLIPGDLLEYAMSGSSLTYQNIGLVYDDFLRRCLRPNYLHKIEEAMSDLIPRAFAARFDTDALTLADAKTRFETYGIGIDKGIITPEQAQAFEGLQPGDTDLAPVPFSPPQAQVTILPTQQRTAEPVRCDGKRVKGRLMQTCGAWLANEAPFVGYCRKCGKEYGLTATA